MPVKVRDWAEVAWLSQSEALRKTSLACPGYPCSPKLRRACASTGALRWTPRSSTRLPMARSMAWVIALARAKSVIKSDGRSMDTRREALANLLDKRTPVR